MRTPLMAAPVRARVTNPETTRSSTPRSPPIYKPATSIPRAAAVSAIPRAVVDGLAVLDAARTWAGPGTGGDTFIDRMLAKVAAGSSFNGAPKVGDPKLVGTLIAIDEIADALDALSDLALSESECPQGV